MSKPVISSQSSVISGQWPVVSLQCSVFSAFAHALSLITVYCLLITSPVHASTVTGLVQNVSSVAAAGMRIQLTPTNTPVVISNVFYYSQPVSATVEADGSFIFTNLIVGAYRTRPGDLTRDAITLFVPNDTNTYNWVTLTDGTGYHTLTNYLAPFVRVAQGTNILLITNGSVVTIHGTATGSGGGGGGGTGEVSTAQLLVVSNQTITASNSLRALLIANDTTTSNGAVAFTMTASNTLALGYIANGAAVSNALAALLVANDTTTSNALRTTFIANDITTSNGLYALIGSGSQTPWASDINGNGKLLTNVASITGTGSTNPSIALVDTNTGLAVALETFAGTVRSNLNLRLNTNGTGGLTNDGFWIVTVSNGTNGQLKFLGNGATNTVPKRDADGVIRMLPDNGGSSSAPSFDATSGSGFDSQ